jgi:NADPH:quinone reductase-like Zn-dependent oxidoreductase
VVARLDECAPMPESLSFEEAASLPLSSQTALQALRDLGRATPGSEVLVNGASGGVGTLAVQIARALGARVTAVSSAANHELVRALGADAVVDYRVVDPLAARDAYDVVFGVFGNRRWDRAQRALRAGGTYVTTVPSLRIVTDSLRSLLGRRRARLVVVRSRRSDLLAIARMVREGRLRPVVERVLPLARIAEAHAHLETKRARGKVVLIP